MSDTDLDSNRIRAEIRWLEARTKSLEAKLEREGVRPSILQRMLSASTRLDAIVKTALAVGVFWFGFWQVDKQLEAQRTSLAADGEKSREQLRLQSERDARELEAASEVRRMELRKAYWTEQLRFYEEGADVAATISRATRLADVETERGRFWSLYWGQMSLVEHPEVEGAMVAFGGALEKWEKDPKSKPELTGLSFELAHCFRASLEKTWSLPGAPVLGDKCPYVCDQGTCTRR